MPNGLESRIDGPILGQMLVDPVVVFRSGRRLACDERAFVLTAVLIDSEIIDEIEGYALQVSHSQAAHAAHHLHQYDAERRKPRPQPPAIKTFPHAWWGSTFYATFIILVALITANHLPARELYDIGAVQGTLLSTGQWWRAFTALTLHWDLQHLLGNLAGGALFGYFAAKQLGNGRAWLLILIAAGLANLIEVSLVSNQYVSAGASTAVFAAVGLLAAHTWKTRRGFGLPGWREVAPLIGGLLLLAWLGTEGEHTDVLSHGLGFLCGGLAGLIAASRLGAVFLERIPQRVAGAAALAWLALCWWLALT